MGTCSQETGPKPNGSDVIWTQCWGGKKCESFSKLQRKDPSTARERKVRNVQRVYVYGGNFSKRLKGRTVQSVYMCLRRGLRKNLTGEEMGGEDGVVSFVCLCFRSMKQQCVHVCERVCMHTLVCSFPRGRIPRHKT